MNEGAHEVLRSRQVKLRGYLDKLLEEHDLAPYTNPKRWAKTTKEEQDNTLRLQMDVQDIELYIQQGDPVDEAGFKRVAAIALADGTFNSFAKSIHTWRIYLNAFHYFCQHHPQFFPSALKKEIRPLWGELDAQVIYEKYIVDRIPEKYWPENRFSSAGPNG